MEIGQLPAIGDWDRRTFLRLIGAATGSALAAPSLAATSAPDISAMSAINLSATIHRRSISCVEVMTACLDRIDALNPKVNAIVALQDREDLLQQARARDAMLASGRSMGPLHGFPHAVKDLQPVKGLPFTGGSPILRGNVAKADGMMVERLRASGAIFIGKTNTPEFGFGSHTYNPVYGVTRNAWDQSRSAGGSTGGGAVALALRMVPLADGSDYGGSLRNPAGWNNVCGFRCSIGRVPNTPDEWLPSMGVVGPMARNIGDLALLLSVQAGHDARAPLSMESRPPFAGSLRDGVKGKRLGWLGDFGGVAPCEPVILDTCSRALKTLEGIGCHVEDALPDFPADQAWNALIKLRGWQQGANILAYYNDPAKRALLKPEARYEVEIGLGLSAFDISQTSTVRAAWSKAFRTLFDRFDYLIAPTAQLMPFDATLHWPSNVAGHAMRTYHEWMKGCCLVTLAGCPALAAPAGFAPDGLPVGLQIIAPVGHEMACLQLGAAYEAASDWSHRSPPLASLGGS